MLDKTIAQNLSKELKIDLFTIYREYLQFLFLKYFYTQKESEKIYFKGGTSLRFLYNSFRFSEDLDFTGLLPEKKIKVFINKTLKDLKKEIKGVTFKKTNSIANSFSGRIFQENPEFKFPLTIRLDFSFRERPFLMEVSYIETIFPIGPFPQVSHLKIEEIMAEKIRAILTRTRGRDIFDLWFMFSQKVPLDWNLINKKMALYKKKTDLSQLIRCIEKFPQSEIEEDLRRFLPTTHRSLVKTIKELILEKLKMTEVRPL